MKKQKATVKSFYEHDHVSRQVPGRKDAIIIRKHGKPKTKVQTRHLSSSLKETFALFVKEHPDISIGKSTLADLCPPHMSLSNKPTHNVCLCKYHENHIAAVDALHKAVPQFPEYSIILVFLQETFLCNLSSQMCWMNECKDGKRF